MLNQQWCDEYGEYDWITTICNDEVSGILELYGREIGNPWLEEDGWEYVIVRWFRRNSTVVSRFKNGKIAG